MLLFVDKRIKVKIFLFYHDEAIFCQFSKDKFFSMSQAWNLHNQNYPILDKLASFSNSFAISSGNKIIGLDTTRDVV